MWILLFFLFSFTLSFFQCTMMIILPLILWMESFASSFNIYVCISKWRNSTVLCHLTIAVFSNQRYFPKNKMKKKWMYASPLKWRKKCCRKIRKGKQNYNDKSEEAVQLKYQNEKEKRENTLGRIIAKWEEPFSGRAAKEWSVQNSREKRIIWRSSRSLKRSGKKKRR